MLLNREFFDAHSKNIEPFFFPPEIQPLVKTLKYAHTLTDNAAITTDELRELHFSINPTLTKARRDVLIQILDNINDEPDFNPAIASEIITQTYRGEICRQIAELSLQLESGQSDDWNKLNLLVAELSTSKESDKEYDTVSLDDVEYLLEDLSTQEYEWKFNMDALQNATGGLPAGSFGIVAARPEVGKTAFYISLACAPGGWVDQGAKVHVWRNEERYSMLAKRVISSYLGCTLENAVFKMQEFKEKRQGQSGNIYILKDSVTDSGSLKDIEQYLIDNEVDILIIDQIDNLVVNGRPVREDLNLLNTVYSDMRELASRYSCAIMVLTQAGATAQGKLYFGYSDLYGSKTGKAAAADYIFCIGALPVDEDKEDSGIRGLNFAKNKLRGPHAPIIFRLKHDITRAIAGRNELERINTNLKGTTNG